MILNLKEKPSWSLVQVHTTDKHPDFAEDIEKFIYSASNLRAKNFGLKEIGEFEFKQMALNIPQILVMVSSMPACLAIIDAIKLCVVSSKTKKLTFFYIFRFSEFSLNLNFTWRKKRRKIEYSPFFVYNFLKKMIFFFCLFF